MLHWNIGLPIFSLTALCCLQTHMARSSRDLTLLVWHLELENGVLLRGSGSQRIYELTLPVFRLHCVESQLHNVCKDRI